MDEITTAQALNTLWEHAMGKKSRQWVLGAIASFAGDVEALPVRERKRKPKVIFSNLYTFLDGSKARLSRVSGEIDYWVFKLVKD